MEKEFVPYELSLELKELGFDEPCLLFIQYSSGTDVFTNKKFKNSIWLGNGYDAEVGNKKIKYKFPKKSKQDYVFLGISLYQQAFKWFREKYNLVHTVYSNASGYIWELHYNQEKGGTHVCDSGESGDCEMSGMFTTYEKAELECLKKLIEICKKH